MARLRANGRHCRAPGYHEALTLDAGLSEYGQARGSLLPSRLGGGMVIAVLAVEALMMIAGGWYYGAWFWVPLIILAIPLSAAGFWVKRHPEQFVRACEGFGSGYLDRVENAADAWRTRHVVTHGPRLSDDPRYAAMRAGQERSSDNEELASSPR